MFLKAMNMIIIFHNFRKKMKRLRKEQLVHKRKRNSEKNTCYPGKKYVNIDTFIYKYTYTVSCVTKET